MRYKKYDLEIYLLISRGLLGIIAYFSCCMNILLGLAVTSACCNKKVVLHFVEMIREKLTPQEKCAVVIILNKERYSGQIIA